MLKGVVCPQTQQFETFDTCCRRHNDSEERDCNAPRFLLNELSKNDEKRKEVRISTTVLTGCARSYAIKQSRPYFIELPSGWNMARGSWAHAMFENGHYSEHEYLIEERLRKYFDYNGVLIPVTGQPDEVNRVHGILIDYKTKHMVPTSVPIEHEAQFNIYIWLLRGGEVIEGKHTGEVVDVPIVRGGMHYVSWQPKVPWRRIQVPIWDIFDTEEWMMERMAPLLSWKESGILPSCNSLFTYGKCECQKLEESHNDYWREHGIIR